MNLRTASWPRAIVHTLGMGLCALLALGVLPSATSAQGVDYAILSCSIVDTTDPAMIDLVLEVGVLTPQTGAWDVPIDIFFDGVRVEPRHILVIEQNFLQPCQQTFPNCELPFPCGFTKWSYKGRGPFFENWRCLANFNTNTCDCVVPGPPVPHKTVRRPSISSFFDVFVDLDLQVPETNEQNNHCRVFYAGPTPGLSQSWGAIKDLYYH